MEQEKEEVTDTRHKPREAFEIEGIGEFRAKPGTAVAELAGAASYWHKKAKERLKLLESHGRRKWIDGFSAGVGIALILGLVTWWIVGR